MNIEQLELSLNKQVKQIHINAMQYALQACDYTEKTVKVLNQSDLKTCDHDYFYFEESGLVYRVSWEKLESDIHQICGFDCRECGNLSECMAQIWVYYEAYTIYIKNELNIQLSTHIELDIENSSEKPTEYTENAQQPIMWFDDEDQVNEIEYGI